MKPHAATDTAADRFADPTFPAPRVTPHALHALGGVWRLTARRFFAPGYWLTLAGMLALLVVFSIPATSGGEDVSEYLQWVSGFYVSFVLPILAFIAAAGAMRDDLGAGTVDYVFTRPVRRSSFVVFRYLAQMACTQIDFLFALAVVLGLGVWHGVPDLWPAVPVLLLGQFTGIVVFSAFGVLCALLTSRYIIVGLLYGAVVEVGLGNVPTQLNQISLVRHLLAILRPILGNGEWAIAQTALTSTASTPATVAGLFAAAALMIAVGAALFRAREFAGTGRDT